jgi:hypothetical protein
MSHVFGAILVGFGATLIMDLWALFMRHAFGVTSLNYCIVGRWLRYMPDGIFKHTSIAAAPAKSSECAVGWIAHYATGAIFAVALVILTSGDWLQHPTLLPALLFGISTVAIPFLIMQPSFGLGVAASKTPRPMQARFRSILTHAIFGVGLYICAVVFSQVFRVHV